MREMMMRQIWGRLGMTLVWLVGVGIFVLGGAACAKEGAVSRPTSGRSLELNVAKKDSVKGGLSGKNVRSGDAAKVRERRVIRRGELHLQVAKYKKFSQSLEAKVSSLRGYVADLRLSRSVHRVSSVMMVLRVPSAQFASFLGWVRKQGRVSYERLGGEDITSKYVDLQARLANLRRLEKRFLRLLETRTATLKDVVSVERELARVRGEIERWEGQKKTWDRLVALATLRLHVRVREPFRPMVTATFGQELQETLGGSLRALGLFLRGTLLVVVALLPWIVLLGTLGFVVFWLVRRARQKRALPNQP